MRGYKILNKDMNSLFGEMTYELGKIYTIETELQICKNGYHFMKDLVSIYKYYGFSTDRIFEIDTLDGEYLYDDNKYCTNKIKLVRELSKNEIINCVKNNLDVFIYNKNALIRRAVALLGLELDKMINDESYLVREVVAKQGYGLEKLINDVNPFVRRVADIQLYGKNYVPSLSQYLIGI